MSAAAELYEEPPDALAKALGHAAHLLPAQAPLASFVHHNTLHAFEHLPFHEAVREAEQLLGGQPYLPIGAFRAAYARGRIRARDVDATLDLFLMDRGDEPILEGVTRRALARIAMIHELAPDDVAQCAWVLAEGSELDAFPPAAARQPLLANALAFLLDDESALRDRCHVEAAPTRIDLPRLRHDPEPLVRRAYHVHASRITVDAARQESAAPDEPNDPSPRSLFFRLASAYLDAGLAYWAMPGREDGFFTASVRLLALAGGPWESDRAIRQRARAAKALDGEAFVRTCLGDAGIQEVDWADRILSELLEVRGFAGMFATLEADRSLALTAFPHRLVDALAVWWLVRPPRPRHETKTSRRRQLDAPRATTRDAIALARLAIFTGIDLPTFVGLDARDGRRVLDELQAFGDRTRRQVWQEAYERAHRHAVLDAVALNDAGQRALTPAAPRLQVACCIDDREESLRRHIEEQDPAYETIGIAGFYGLAIAYQGVSDPHARPLLPAGRKPTHRIEEQPATRAGGWAFRRRWMAELGFGGHVGSRTLLRGSAASMTGIAQTVPLLLDVFAPRRAARLRAGLARTALRPPKTRLSAFAGESAQSEATASHDHDHQADDALPTGYDVEEAADVLAGVLHDAGVHEFAPLFIALGHGSTSMNNPHEAAHECGACSGGKGGANARLFAVLANDPRVRTALAERGLEIPEETVFVGGIHDTSSDAVTLFDLDAVPDSHAELLAETKRVLLHARALDAHERVRRFDSVPLGVSPKAALRHVEGRAYNLAEPRPEYGHCTNAICLVGRRWLSRGLFLDRRAFLVSYDPTRDPDGDVLARVLRSVGPVGAGINLEYYFSTVDQNVYGCGTKLPHNVNGLVGVMNGHESDLRTGLPYQMVDVHEPVRLVTVVEATPERLLDIAEREPVVGRLVTGGWIQLVAADPESGALFEFGPGGFTPYTPDLSRVSTYSDSRACYQAHREDRRPARILAGLPETSRREKEPSHA